MAEHDPIVYRYKPQHDGDGFTGVPRRDLRQSDVDALIGDALRHVTVPDVANPVYVAVQHKSDAKKTAPKAAAKADAPVIPESDAPADAPNGEQKGGE